MITFDYGGGRGGLAIDYVIKNRKIFRGFLKFSNSFSNKNLHNFQKILSKFSQNEKFQR